MCHSIAKLPINVIEVGFKNGRVGWKSQGLRPSIHVQ